MTTLYRQRPAPTVGASGAASRPQQLYRPITAKLNAPRPASKAANTAPAPLRRHPAPAPKAAPTQAPAVPAPIPVSVPVAAPKATPAPVTGGPVAAAKTAGCVGCAASAIAQAAAAAKHAAALNAAKQAAVKSAAVVPVVPSVHLDTKHTVMADVKADLANAASNAAKPIKRSLVDSVRGLFGRNNNTSKAAKDGVPAPDAPATETPVVVPASAVSAVAPAAPVVPDVSLGSALGALFAPLLPTTAVDSASTAATNATTAITSVVSDAATTVVTAPTEPAAVAVAPVVAPAAVAQVVPRKAHPMDAFTVKAGPSVTFPKTPEFQAAVVADMLKTLQSYNTSKELLTTQTLQQLVSATLSDVTFVSSCQWMPLFYSIAKHVDSVAKDMNWGIVTKKLIVLEMFKYIVYHAYAGNVPEPLKLFVQMSLPDWLTIAIKEKGLMKSSKFDVLIAEQKRRDLKRSKFAEEIQAAKEKAKQKREADLAAAAASAAVSAAPAPADTPASANTPAASTDSTATTNDAMAKAVANNHAVASAARRKRQLELKKRRATLPSK